MGKLFMRLGGWTLNHIWERYKGPGRDVRHVQAVVSEHAISKEEDGSYLFQDGVARITETGQTVISLNEEK